MTTNLLTQKYKTYLATKLQDAVTQSPNTAFYFYTGVHGDVIGDVPVPNNDEREMMIDAYRNMIFGKRVGASDVALVVRNIPWATDTVFAKYDDNDDDIFTKDFFCYVNEGSFLHVYKCLDNNFNALSTVEPQFAWVTEASNYIFQTSDGYVWKYMYSFTDAQHAQFTTQNYIPAYTNTTISNNTVAGALDVIHIEQNNPEIPGGGRKYDNYVTGTFSTNQLRVNGNNFLYAISNDNIHYTTGFYTGCLIYLSGGTGVGQYSNIVHYFTNSNGNFIVIDTVFTVSPTNGTEFEIYPNVKISGSGTETVNAVARALVNSTGSNSVYKIEMLEKGSHYTYAAAEVVANAVVTDDTNFIATELRPIYGPAEGHGKNPALELGSDAVEFTMSFSNSESGTLLTENRYQQIGLLRDPKFSNVNIEITNSVGTFTTDEVVSKFTLRRINANVAISANDNIIWGEMSALSNASVASSGTAGSYIPDDILTIEGGTFVVPAQLRVLTTTVRTVEINDPGSGYTPGNFNANLNLGTATTNAIFTVTANSSGECESIIISEGGVYTDNPPDLANSAPVGGDGSGLTVTITMGLDSVQIFGGGAYAVLPTDLTDNEPLSNVGTGAGAEVLIAFTPTLSSDFENQLDVGDFIYITSSDHSSQMLATVNSITNATSLEITTNGLFSCAAAMMYYPTRDTTARVRLVANATNILLANVSGTLATGDLLIGETSSAKAQVNVVTRNEVSKNLHSFVQLYKYDVGVLSGEFIENEIVYQGNSLSNATATALLHSVVNGTIMYTSNQVGNFVDTTYIQGANSLAIASINESYSPELEFGSGRVLYIENLDPVERANNRTESLQILLTF